MPRILQNKHPLSPSVFAPSALLREARRQRGLPTAEVPPLCILDPDGDIVRQLRRTGKASSFEAWPCYHTQLDTFALGPLRAGIVGCAVGAPFAVLVAEQLFASGCRLLISLTSAGQITAIGTPPYFIIIDRALRDEGTSYHYASPADYADANTELVSLAREAADGKNLRVIVGPTWTTDAPFRETAEAIDTARSEGILAVEMEAAALYTLAQTSRYPVLCLAHVTNTMGQTAHDFEKGAHDGSADALTILEAVASLAHSRRFLATTAV
ncbi:MAG: nucleoside phosphorylase [Pseudolabrys sp.]